MNGENENIKSSHEDYLSESMTSDNNSLGGVTISNDDYSNEVAMEEMPMETISDSSLREIKIKPLSSGFMVTVGCQSIAVETVDKLTRMLNLYLTNPSDFESKWFSKSAVNRLENIETK